MHLPCQYMTAPSVYFYWWLLRSDIAMEGDTVRLQRILRVANTDLELLAAHQVSQCELDKRRAFTSFSAQTLRRLRGKHSTDMFSTSESCSDSPKRGDLQPSPTGTRLLTNTATNVEAIARVAMSFAARG